MKQKVWFMRKDFIWRFIAVIFLAHAGTIDIWQEGQAISDFQEFRGDRIDGYSGSIIVHPPRLKNPHY